MMKAIFIVCASLVALSASACGGGSTPAAPSATPASPAPTGITVSATADNRVACFVEDVKGCDTVYTAGGLSAGWQSNQYVTGGSGSALKFELPSQVLGRTVTKATLRLYADLVPDQYPVRPVLRVHAFAVDWDTATLTWNVWKDLACHDSGEAQQPAPTVKGPLEFDVTTIVANWAASSWRNYGFRLMVNRPRDGEWGQVASTWFRSLENAEATTERPQLVIEHQ